MLKKTWFYLFSIFCLSIFLSACSNGESTYLDNQYQENGLEFDTKIVKTNEDGKNVQIVPTIKNISNQTVTLEYAKPIGIFYVGDEKFPSNSRDDRTDIQLKPGQSINDQTTLIDLEPNTYDSKVYYYYTLNGTSFNTEVDFNLTIK